MDLDLVGLLDGNTGDDGDGDDGGNGNGDGDCDRSGSFRLLERWG